MTAKTFASIAAVIFTIIALLQLTRAVSGWDVTIDATVIPMWASWLAGLVAATLAWLGFTVRD